MLLVVCLVFVCACGLLVSDNFFVDCCALIVFFVACCLVFDVRRVCFLFVV